VVHAGASLDELETLYRDRGEAFFRFACARTGDVEQARDAVQEGFARAIRSRMSYRRTGPLDAWVARCVINVARDAVDASNGDAAIADERNLPPAPDEDLDTAAVRAAIRALPRRQRDALFLRFYLDLDYAAIADTLGIAVGSVSATLHAARIALSEQLQEVTR
jgi:RNA polymerase sigma factor (sigma-70 family)